MLNSRDIRDFLSPGNITVLAGLPANSRPTKHQSRQSRPGEVKYVPRSRPAPGYMEFSPGIQSGPGPGLAGLGEHSRPGADL